MSAARVLAVALPPLLLVQGPPPARPGGAPGVGSGAAAEPGRGAPGWQQAVRYTIEARLEEERGVLEGAALLAYRNASPDTLDRLQLHLYLNAFRPHSLWARTERRRQYDFRSLGEPDFGYERLRSARLVAGPGAPPGEGPGAPPGEGPGAPAGEGPAGVVSGDGGLELRATYPNAPDSTLVQLELPAALPPGDSLLLRLAWRARPSTLCRRQCRRGRHFDFAQWYPRIAVYDDGGWQGHPLYPQGEFYGEFGSYDVTLEVAADQVIGATGVPVDGDPGWRPVAGSPRTEPLYQREWYALDGREPSPGLLGDAPGAGRKRVRFQAEEVHHFAWSADPEYRYEGGLLEPAAGRERPVAVHVLFRPGDQGAWGGGQAVGRTLEALAWLESIFGPYPYPQLTNLHRLEGGGTEFPMVIMNGSASPGVIVHETTHQYAHGILANNEWKEAWLDEGFTSFLTAWFFEEQGAEDPWRRALEGVAALDRPGGGQPVATVSEGFRDFRTYGAMVYSKASVVFYMLRELVGEERFRELLRAYYERYRLRHVDEEAFRRVAEEVSGRDLGWFFEQWLHTTATLDYGIEEARAEPLADGSYRTRVVVTRAGEAWMPVVLRVGPETRELDSRARRQVVEVLTGSPPESAELDPDRHLLDVDRSNDRVEVEWR
ncbi:MAG: M1 family metallopeptidase [Gemmatimonadota bacterium]